MVVGLDGCGKTSLIAGLRGVRERSGRAAAAQGLGEVGTHEFPNTDECIQRFLVRRILTFESIGAESHRVDV